MALRELVTVLRYELKDGNLKKYVEGYRSAEKQINAVAKVATDKLRTALGRANGEGGRLDKTLRGMSPAMQQLAAQARQLQRTINQTNSPTSKLLRGFSRLKYEVREFGIGLRQGARQGFGEVLRQMDRVEAKQRRLNREARSSRSRSVGADFGSVGGMIQGLIGLATGKAFADASDDWAGTNARIGLQTPDDYTRNRSRDFLFRTAQRTGQMFPSLSDTFVSMARGRESLGLSNDQTLLLSSNVSKLMTIGGGSAASQDAALVQFGQAMNTGVLRGEELNSILEQAPRLAKAIADALGTSVGNLRQLGQDGKITSKAIADGLLRQTQQIDSEFERLPMTFSRSMTQIRNSFMRRAGEMNQQYRLADRFNVIAQAVIENMGKIGAALAAIAGSYAAVKVFRALGTVLGFLQRTGRVAILFFSRLASGRTAQAFAKLGTVGLRFLRVIRSITTAMAAIGSIGAGPVLIVVAAIAAAAAAIYKYWQPISAFLIGVWEGFASVIGPAMQELVAAFQPLAPVFAELAVLLGRVWRWFIELLAPVIATQQELDNATANGRVFGQVLALNLRLVIGLVTMLVRAFAAVSQAALSVRTMVAQAWNAIVGTFQRGWAALTGAIPSWAKTGLNMAASTVGMFGAISPGSVVNAGRSAQNVSNTNNATVNVTAPPGANPAAYGAAAQRGTSKAMTGFQYQLPTPVESF